jgi:hypothetical protein
MNETKNSEAWINAAPAARESHKVRNAVIIAFAAIGAMILAVTLIGTLAGNGTGGRAIHPAPNRTTTAPHKVVPVPNEKADLTSFTLDDRSQAGITDIWIRMEITNHSSKKSDYMIEWQAVDAAGVRIDSGTEAVLGVLPHQATTQPVLTTVDHVQGVHLDIVNIDRTASVD